MKTYSLCSLPAGGWIVLANGSETPVLLIENSRDLAIFKATLAPTYGEPVPASHGSEVQRASDASA